MLDRQHGKFVVECDSCGDTLQTDTRDFEEAREVMRLNDWKARKIGRDWIHGCPECGVPKEGSML
ncbi:hypothetical protein ACRQ5Q_22465 [Bradyrhizobium sp. PMVTL-01]|uniref:hypothetical protein n=1 Tax=Bradyrhizobium sp. PMVTL-01 TaxID=3434999 RepID=UPI003F6E45D5